MMAPPKRRKPVKQLCVGITTPVTPAFKAACRRGAAKHRLPLSEYVRNALSQALTADKVPHQIPVRNSSSGVASS